MTTITQPTDTLPRIIWKRLNIEDNAGDGYTFMYYTVGVSKSDNRTFSGVWIECCDEIEIEDIEIITKD